jgi:hypothetical protein
MIYKDVGFFKRLFENLTNNITKSKKYKIKLNNTK